MELHCPNCQNPLEPSERGAHCATCHQDYQVEARCPECHQPLEVLKACGAVDYFCRNGHGLISKKRVEFMLQAH
ncbi:zinc ribbon domain-containing protein [Cronobacter dublinensis]